MITTLLRPFSYLTIRHETGLPQWINWWVPAAFAGAVVSTAWLLQASVDVTSSNGLIAKLLAFVQNLPGFYIAALAAIATFANPDMLKLMPGVPPTIRVMYHGQLTTVELTRRRFLTSMFAFLTASSIGVTLLSIAALALAEPVKAAVVPQMHGPIKAIFCFVHLTFVGQMVTVTLWGLFYLGERIHTPD